MFVRTRVRVTSQFYEQITRRSKECSYGLTNILGYIRTQELFHQSSLRSIVSGVSTSTLYLSYDTFNDYPDKMAEMMMPVRHERVIYDRNNPFDYMHDNHLIEKYRFPKHILNEIIDLVWDDMVPHSWRNDAISVHVQVATALQFLATGSFFNVESSVHGISKSSVSRCVDKFVNSLCRQKRRFIEFPSDEQQQRNTMMSFYDVAGFPGVLGAIDGTQIPITRPVREDNVFVCRKGYPSINVQGVCGAKKEFLDIVAQWPGSTHDNFIWSSCHLARRFENGEIQNGWLIGDSGYGLKSHLLTPFLATETIGQRRYNSAHRKTRVLIENAFGILKARFRCLDKSGGKLMFPPTKCCKIITAAAILHNIAISHQMPEPNVQDIDFHTDYLHEGPIDNNGQATRNGLVSSVFI